MQLGPTELIIILVIVVLLFGVGRISKVAGEMGHGVRAFREGLGNDEKQQQNISDDNVTAPSQAETSEPVKNSPDNSSDEPNKS